MKSSITRFLFVLAAIAGALGMTSQAQAQLVTPPTVNSYTATPPASATLGTVVHLGANWQTNFSSGGSWNTGSQMGFSWFEVYVSAPTTPAASAITCSLGGLGYNVQSATTMEAGTYVPSAGGGVINYASDTFNVTLNQVGTWTIYLVTGDGRPWYGQSNTYTITVTAPPPVVTSAGSAAGNYNTAFPGYQITASNSPTSYNASGLPPGLSVNTATGLISGTPTAVGTYSASVSASNVGGTGSLPVTFTISPGAQTLTWVLAPTATYASGTGTYQASGASSGVYNWSVTAGPTGFSGTGPIQTLTFPAAGSYTVTVNAAGNGNYSASAPISTVMVVDQLPSISGSVSPSIINFGQSATVSSTATANSTALTALSMMYNIGGAQTWATVPGITYNITGWSTPYPNDTTFFYSGQTYATETASGATYSKSFVVTPKAAGGYNNFSAWAWDASWTGASQAYLGGLTVNKATPSISFIGRAFTGTHTIVAGDLAATASNPYSGGVAAPTGAFTYAITSASGVGASPTSGAVTVGTVMYPGTYTIQASYPGDSNYNANSSSQTYTITATSVGGSFTSGNNTARTLTNSFENGDTANIVGWAFAPDTNAPVASVSLYVDGVFKATIPTGVSSPSAVAVYGAAATNAGFNSNIVLSGLAYGSHSYYVTAGDTWTTTTLANGGSNTGTFLICAPAPTVTASYTVSGNPISNGGTFYYGQTVTAANTVTASAGFISENNLYLQYNGGLWTWQGGTNWDGATPWQLVNSPINSSSTSLSRTATETPGTNFGTYTFETEGWTGFSGNTRPLGAGASGTYSPMVSLTYAKATPAAVFAAENITPGGATYTVTAANLNATFANPYNPGGTIAPTGTVTYTIVGPGTVIVPGVTTLNAGSGYTIQASYPGDSNYNSTSINSAWAIGHATQTISFTPSVTMNNGSSQTLSATATSALPVSYAVTGPATLVGNTLTATGAGTITVTATQAGNASWLAATPVVATITSQWVVTVGAGTGGTAVSSPVGAANNGATVTFTATPSGGYRFGSWTGPGAGMLSSTTSATATATASANINVTANFVQQFTLTLTISGTGSGVFTGQGTYDIGTVVPFSITPNGASLFAGWNVVSGPGLVNPTSSTQSATMTSNLAYSANLALLATASNGGTVNFTNPLQPSGVYWQNSLSGYGLIVTDARTGIITNTGNVPLVITAIGISQVGAAQFTTTTPFGALPLSIAPSGTPNGVVTFDPTTVGAMTATMTFFTTDPNNPVVFFTLTGTGLPPPPPSGSVARVNGSGADIPLSENIYAGDSLGIQFQASDPQSAIQSVLWYATYTSGATGITTNYNGTPGSPNVINSIGGAAVNSTIHFIMGPYSGSGMDTYQIYMLAVDNTGQYSGDGTGTFEAVAPYYISESVHSPTTTIVVATQANPKAAVSGWLTASPVANSTYTIQRPR